MSFPIPTFPELLIRILSSNNVALLPLDSLLFKNNKLPLPCVVVLSKYIPPFTKVLLLSILNPIPVASPSVSFRLDNNKFVCKPAPSLEDIIVPELSIRILSVSNVFKLKTEPFNSKGMFAFAASLNAFILIPVVLVVPVCIATFLSVAVLTCSFAVLKGELVPIPTLPELSITNLAADASPSYI